MPTSLKLLTAGLCTTYIAYQMSPYVFPMEVVSVLDGANCQNIAAGDLIVGVQGRFALPIRASMVQDILNKGNEGESVEITVLKKDQMSPIKVNVTRSLQSAPKVEWSLLPTAGDDTGYLRIREFSTTCLQDCRQALLDLSMALARKNASLNGLVVDLRDNLGGSMVSGLELASLFSPYNSLLLRICVEGKEQRIHNTYELSALSEGRTLLQRLDPRRLARHFLRLARSTRSATDPTDHIGSFLNTALMILVNENTASASEIFVHSILCNHRFVRTAGSRTVGKNKAQAMIKLNDGTGLIFSICEFKSPCER